MTDFGSVRRQHDASTAPDRELVSTIDDFSVKVSSAIDRCFWVRIERETVRGTLIVTDFTPGQRPIEELEAGVAMAVRAVARQGISGIAFRDLVPGGEQTHGFPARLVHAADLAKRLGAVAAEELATNVAGFDMQPRHGKVDAIVTFEQLRVV